MTLYYKLVFALLVFEVIVFGLLIVPLPLAARRKLFTFISTNQVVGHIQYGLKISFIFVFVLFIDACQRVYRMEEDNVKDQAAGYMDVRADNQMRATKFYNHRNLYLTGFTLFLSLILNRFYALLGELLAKDIELEHLKKGTGPTAAAKIGQVNADKLKEGGKLKKNE